jgi:hypothetical protein
MEKKNCYNTQKQWFRFTLETEEMVTTIHTALYWRICALNNQKHWIEVIDLPTKETMKVIGLRSYKAYKKALFDLIRWGFVILISKAQNQWKNNQVALVLKTKAKNNALASETKANDNALSLETKAKGVALSLETKAKIGNALFSAISDDAKLLLNVYKNKTLFDIFLKLFEIKENPENLRPLFDKLSEAEQVNIIKNLPYYIFKHPDIKYRHFPENYLKNRLWKKFIDPGEHFTLNGISYHLPEPKKWKD